MRAKDPSMRHGRNLPSALTTHFTRLPARVQDPHITNAAVTAVTHSTLSRDTTDVCAEMFKFCKQCDEKYLHPRKIQCLFDVDSGVMHRGALQVVCQVIETLLADISQNGVCHANGASLTVTLRRQHGVWILAVTERHIASLRQAATVRRLSLVRRRAQLLGAACRVHQTNEGFITALMFDSTAVTSGWRDCPPSETVH